MFYLILGILNALIGTWYIYNGIKKQGKKEFLNYIGFFYIFWVIGSTIYIMSYL
jgi:hypothetical protein